MKRKLLATLLCLAAALAVQAAIMPQAIRVSENGHYLIGQDGKPFFYLGDTAWELFHRLTREEADEYLRARAAQGFTVIQAVALAEFGGLDVPNAYGFLPLVGKDPAHPAVKPGENDDYWDNVDWIVSRANGLGLYVGLLPTWGSHWHDGGKPAFNPQNAYTYGKWIAGRYRNAKIIWILGGDRNPGNDRQRAIIREMARGLREGDGGSHLITYHPGGAWGSADFFHGEEWIDFNMRQNGHNTWYEIYAKTLVDYNRVPARPVIDGEPVYEDHPVAFDAARRGHSVAADCRRALYWDLFNGACGHTYGHHSVWQFYDYNRQPVNNPLMTWREALNQPGASQMKYAKELLLGYDYPNRIPATDMVLAGNNIKSAWPGEGIYHFAATMDAGGSYLMVYAPVGRRFGVNTTVLRGEDLCGWWFNPRNGRRTKIGKVKKAASVSFITPTPGEETDWVLIVETKNK